MKDEEIVDLIIETYSDGAIKGHYKITCHNKTFRCVMSKKKLRKYVEVSLEIEKELSRLIECGRLTHREFEHDQINIQTIVHAFSEEGALNTLEMQKLIYKIGEKIRKLDVETAAWMFIWRPGICAAIYATAEAMVNENKELQRKKLMDIFKRPLIADDWRLLYIDHLLRTLLSAEYCK